MTEVDISPFFVPFYLSSFTIKANYMPFFLMVTLQGRVVAVPTHNYICSF